MRISAPSAAIVMLALVWSAPAAAAPAVEDMQARPAALLRDVATPVLFTARIIDSTLIAGSVNLLKVDAAGRTIATLSVLRDDGLGGDTVAGDKIFSVTVTLRETAATYYRVSAGFRGVLLRVLSTPVTIGITTGPTISVSLSPTANANGWNRTPVTAHFTCSAPGSSVASCPPDRLLSADGAGQTVTGTVVDVDGRTQSVTSGPINIDQTAPAIDVLVTPQPNAAGWNNAPMTAHFTCVDNGSGVAGCPPDRIVSTEGVTQVAGTVTDAAGNSAAVSRTVSVDVTPPSATIALTPAPNASGIFTAAVTARFSCTDAGSGIASCPPDQIFAVSGSNLIATGAAVDAAGNSAPASSAPFTIQLGGSAAPIITVSLSPQPNANGWHNTPVTAHFTCTSNGAPLAGCPVDRVIATEGANQTVTGSVTDGAGQTATVTSDPFSIDTTPPVLTLSTPTTGTTVFVSSVTLTGILTDAVSGIESASCNGSPALVSVGALTCTVSLTAGANTVTANAVDRAGNPVSASLGFTYNVVPLISILQPANLTYTSISPTTITGSVDDPTARVVVNSVEATVVNGSFSVALPLAEGPNIVTATATSSTGATGTATLWITLDTTPPRVTVTSPSDQFVTTDAAIDVNGIVNDIVVGTVNPEQAAVTVNGVPAQVANRMFLVGNVPLAIGTNVIQVVGRDRVGNQGTTQITVTRVVPSAQPRIQVVSGSGQNGTIRSLLPTPLAIALTDAAGNPAPGKPVIFKVTQNDGLVAETGSAAPTVIATTDPQGRAQVQWTLGGRAGAGGNTVEAYSVGFEGTAIFTATGNQGPAGKIVVDTGNNQYGPIGQRLPRPFVAVVVDEGNNRLGGVPVTFTVSEGGGSFDGEQTSTVVSDPDGRVAATLTLGMQEGESNNIISATFASNQGFPAAFTASGRAPGDPAKTTITGVVLDNSNIPIPGVTVRAVLTQVLNSNANASNLVTPVATDAQGQFTITQAPVGFVKLIVDGSTATLPGSYPTLDYDMVTVAGQNMTVGQPIYLLPINSANSLCVTDTTGGGTLTIPEAPGFSLTFGPGQVTFPGGSKTGCVSVTVVHPDKVPMTPGFGQQPRFIVTIQPAGAVFNPPAPITLPNVDGLAPRATTEMYSFDHDIGSFVAIGTGTVSEDGQVIRSNAGVGVLKAGWHCGGNPNALGTTADCGYCNLCLSTPENPQGECVYTPSNLPPSVECNVDQCFPPLEGRRGSYFRLWTPDGSSCNDGAGVCSRGTCTTCSTLQAETSTALTDAEVSPAALQAALSNFNAAVDISNPLFIGALASLEVVKDCLLLAGVVPAAMVACNAGVVVAGGVVTVALASLAAVDETFVRFEEAVERAERLINSADSRFQQLTQAGCELPGVDVRARLDTLRDIVSRNPQRSFRGLLAEARERANEFGRLRAFSALLEELLEQLVTLVIRIATGLDAGPVIEALQELLGRLLTLLTIDPN